MRPFLTVLVIAASLAAAGCSGLGCNGSGDDRRAGGMCGLHGTFLTPRPAGAVRGR
jgi:hypothetical protein